MAAEHPTQVDEGTLNALPVAVILFDNKQIHFLNKKAIDIFDIPKSELRNLHKFTLFQFLDKKLHPLVKRNNNLLLSGAQLFAFEREFTNFKGKKIVIEANSNAVYFKKKKVIQTVFEEISKRKILATESEMARDLLHKISANSHDVIFHFTFSPRLQLKFISDSTKNVMGYTPEQIYANPEMLKALVHPEDRYLLALSRSEYEKLPSTDKEKKVVLRFKHQSGTYKYLEIVSNGVFDKNKKLVGVIGNMRDVTERMEAEELLIESKKKFDLITNNGNDIIAFYTYLPTEKYLYVSPNIRKILGYDYKMLINDNSFLRDRIVANHEEYEASDKLLRNLQRKNVEQNHHFAFKVLSKKGAEVWLENNLVPITDTRGNIAFFINILRDITEQKEADIEIQNQYLNYRNLLDNSPVAYVIHDHGVCLYVNKALMKLLKLTNKNQALGRFALDFFEESDRKKAIDRIQELYNKKPATAKFHNYVVRDVEGNPLEVEIKSVLIKFNNKDCILSLVNNLSEQRQLERERMKAIIAETTNKQLQKEIRERQEVEKALIERTAHLSSILENSTHLIWTVNERLEVTSFNKNFFRVVKQHHNIEIRPGYKIDEHLPKGQDSYIAFWYPRYREALNGKKLEFEKEDHFREKRIYRKIYINPIPNASKDVREISCIAHDITDSKIYEQKLIKQTGKLSAIFDSSHHYIWTIDRDEKLTSFNRNYFDLVTALYNTQPYVGLVLDRGVLSNDHEYTELLKHHYDKAFKGQATSFEIQTTDKDKKNIYLEIFLNPIYGNDEVVEVSGIAHNITEKKIVQQRMELSLKEKEILLREVHHRVKNNMQVISSILNLQSSYVSDEYALTLLKESQNRIKTMAYIHESLYQNKSFSSVNFSQYVHTLLNNIVQSYSYSNDKIRLNLNLDEVTLSLDSSIPAGLIINELVTNAIKHAFPGDRQGMITFNLRCEDKLVFLELKDDGVGFAPGVDFRNSHSLGLQLVNTLIEQIDADLKFNSGPEAGTEVVVSFKQ
jgi:PAS domain S-box-containing protein